MVGDEDETIGPGGEQVETEDENMEISTMETVVEAGVEIKSITIKFGEKKKEIECTPDEARKLLKALGELFGEGLTKVIYEHHHDWRQHYTPYFPGMYYWYGNGASAGNMLGGQNQ